MPPTEVLWHRLAIKEFLPARRWYARQGAQLEASFVQEIDLALEKITADPRAWPVSEEGCRWVRTRRFQYRIFYSIVDEWTVEV